MMTKWNIHPVNTRPRGGSYTWRLWTLCPACRTSGGISQNAELDAPFHDNRNKTLIRSKMYKSSRKYSMEENIVAQQSEYYEHKMS